MRCILIGIGANIPGCWGAPGETIARLPGALARYGVAVTAMSAIYRTQPLGLIAQPGYYNAVLLARTALMPRALLGVCKRLERAAGRIRGPRNGPRPLDLDILCHDGRVIGRRRRQRANGTLILPHPELHRRAFVLVPLAEVAPRWRHPVLGVTAQVMLRRLRPPPGTVVRA